MRRDFLKLCGLVGLGFAWPGGVCRLLDAAVKEEPPYEGPYYVVFNAAGGWDTTYLMDPKGVGGINRLYQEGDILTQGNLKYAPNAKHAEGGMAAVHRQGDPGRSFGLSGCRDDQEALYR